MLYANQAKAKAAGKVSAPRARSARTMEEMTPVMQAIRLAVRADPSLAKLLPGKSPEIEVDDNF